MRRKLALAVVAGAALLAACGGGTRPAPTTVPPEPAVGVEQTPSGFVGQARDVAGDLNARNAELDQP